MKKIPVFLFLCILASCQFPVYFENTSVQPLTIEVLRPATGIFIPPPGKMLVFPGNKAETRVYVNGAEDTSFRNLSLETLFVITDGVIERLEDSPSLVPVALPPDKIPAPGRKLTWEQIDALAEPDTCASVLTIDQSITVNEAYTEQSSSFYSLESYFTVIAETEIYVRWTLYDREKRIFASKDTTIHTRQMTNWYPTTEEAFNELPAPEDIITQTAREAGYAIASTLSPLWETATRYYFSAGSKDMRTAAGFISSGEFAKADSVWSFLENARSKGIAYHAAYNRIIIEEINGNLASARDKAENLWRKSRMTEAQKYMQLLDKRLQEQEIILRQIEAD